jgi:molybdopterin-guanine dinucleotide biosynthesis protein A
VLAGGRGERLREAKLKPFVVVHGETLVGRAVRLVASVCDAVVVTGPAEWADALAGAAPSARFVADPKDANGPLAGAVAGLSAESFRQAFVLGVDFPLARASAIRKMLAWLRGPRPNDDVADRLAVVPAPGGIPQPLFAAYAPEAFPRLQRSLEDGERSIVVAVSALDPWLVPDGMLRDLHGGLENFVNLNHPEDRAEVERRLAARQADRGAASGAS